MGHKGGIDGWQRARDRAANLAPAEDWRRDLAGAVQRAGDFEFCTVLTCPPSDWYRFVQNSTSEPYDRLLATIRHRFLRDIEAVGEGWRYALDRFGPVYAPLEVARHEEIACRMRALLADADIDGYLASFITDGRRRLLGMVIAGGLPSSRELLGRYRSELGSVVRLASRTLGGALALSQACAEAVPTDLARHLSPREVQVARLAADGYSALNIAARLEISPATVRVHLRRIYRKLGVHSRVELANALRPPSR